MIDWKNSPYNQNLKIFKLTKWEALNLNKKFSMNGETKTYVRLEIGSTLGK